MIFRYARQTNNIELLTEFYTQIIGFKELGRFKNHSNYHGVMIGNLESDWHFEFTESNEPVDHYPDKDDLIILYFNSKKEIDLIINKASNIGISREISSNPYWNEYGIEIKDPDGFGIILTERIR